LDAVGQFSLGNFEGGMCTALKIAICKLNLFPRGRTKASAVDRSTFLRKGALLAGGENQTGCRDGR